MDDLSKINERINEAENLLKRAENLHGCDQNVPGSLKLANRIKSEIRFLKRIQDGKIALKQSHLISTNLTSLKVILDVIESIECKYITSILQPYKDNDGQSICVDIVTSQGRIWVKVIARNATALHAVWNGEGQFGEKNLVDIGKEFKIVAQHHPVDYQTPKILFKFLNGVPEGLAKELIYHEILVDGEIMSGYHDDLAEEYCRIVAKITNICSLVKDVFMEYERNDESLHHYEITKANLDITTMLSLVSNLCNGYNKFVYGLPVLDKQAEQERNSSVLTKLKEFLKDKELIACETAIQNFQTIISTIGGLKEKQRTQELLSKIKVVPDNPTQRTLDLVSSGKLNERAKMVFGTGDHEHAVTVTANAGFVRAAMQNGVKYSVFEHEARALTEQKESEAQLLKMK